MTALVALVLVVVGCVVYVVASGDGSVPRGKEPCEALDGCGEDAQTSLAPASLPEVTDLTVTRNGDSVRVEWTRPDDPEVLGFLVQRCDGADPAPVETTDPFLEVAGVAPGSGFCLQVRSRSADGRISDPQDAVEAG